MRVFCFAVLLFFVATLPGAANYSAGDFTMSIPRTETVSGNTTSLYVVRSTPAVSTVGNVRLGKMPAGFVQRGMVQFDLDAMGVVGLDIVSVELSGSIVSESASKPNVYVYGITLTGSQAAYSAADLWDSYDGGAYIGLYDGAIGAFSVDFGLSGRTEVLAALAGDKLLNLGLYSTHEDASTDFVTFSRAVGFTLTVNERIAIRSDHDRFGGNLHSLAGGIGD